MPLDTPNAAQPACHFLIDQGPINLNHFVVLKGWELRAAVSLSVDQVLIRGLLAQGQFKRGRSVTAGGLESKLLLGSSEAPVISSGALSGRG